MTVFLEDPEMFSDESIVNNLIGFIFVATETTHFASQTLISHLTQSKESLGKLRAEFDSLVRKPALKEDPSLKDLPLGDFMDKAVTLETT